MPTITAISHEQLYIQQLHVIFSDWTEESQDLIRPQKEEVKKAFRKNSLTFFQEAIDVLVLYEEYEMCQAFKELIEERRSI